MLSSKGATVSTSFAPTSPTAPRSRTLFAKERPQRVVNLAAQAGVRYSLTNPHAYIQSNITGFLNILEGCRHTGVEHLVFASSSSVYGANTAMPFSVHDGVDHPLSLYGATKKSNELMAHSYAPSLRPAGHRPALLYRLWPVGAAGHGALRLHEAHSGGRADRCVQSTAAMQRDFTYVDDIVEGVARVLDRSPSPTRPGTAAPPIPRPQPHPTASTISATTRRSS